MKTLILDKQQQFRNVVFKQPIIIKHPGVKFIDCRSEFENFTEKDIAVIIRVDDYVLEGHTCKNVGQGIIADGRNVTIRNCHISNYKEDGIRFMKDGARILFNHITEYIGAPGAHHKDAIQWWSGDQDTNFSSGSINKPIDEGKRRVLRDCHIIGNKIIDDGMVQGIFGSDGLIADFVIKDNVLDLPNSNHSISAWGMHEGTSIIENNDISKCLTPIRLHKTKRGQDPRGTGGTLKVILRGNTLSKTGRDPHIDGLLEQYTDEPIPPVIASPASPEPIQRPPIDSDTSEFDFLKYRVDQLERKLSQASEALGDFRF